MSRVYRCGLSSGPGSPAATFPVGLIHGHRQQKPLHVSAVQPLSSSSCASFSIPSATALIPRSLTIEKMARIMSGVLLLRVIDIADKRTVDLDRVHRQALEVAQGGIPGAEIVNLRFRPPALAAPPACRSHRFQAVQADRFGHFQRQAARRQLRVSPVPAAPVRQNPAV